MRVSHPLEEKKISLLNVAKKLKEKPDWI